MSRLIALSVVFWGLRAFAVEPPRPNPGSPVDYVTWLNAEYTKGLTDNAADLYGQAIAATVVDENLDELGWPPLAWTTEQRQQLSDWVVRNQKALEKFVAAARKSRCYFELEPAGEFLGNADAVTMRFRTLAKVLFTRARLRLESGQTEAAVEDMMTLLGVARHCELQPTVYARLLGASFRSNAFEFILEIPRMQRKEVDFARLLTQFEAACEEPPSLLATLSTEKLMLWDLAQRTLQDADGDGRFESLKKLPKQLKPSQTLDQVLDAVNAWHDQVSPLLALDWSEAEPGFAKITREYDSNEGSFLEGSVPDFSKLVRVRIAAIAHGRGAELVIRLYAHHQKTGRWPEALKEVVAEHADQLDVDPFSGKPFVYFLKNGEPHLYSVSENGIDDGGEVVFRRNIRIPTWKKTGDFVFLPRPVY